MNGLGYGKYSGLSGSHNSMKEFSNTYGRSDWPGIFVGLQPQNNYAAKSLNHIDAPLNARQSRSDQGIRPYSAGSHNTTYRHQRKFRSHEIINQPLTKQVDQLLYEIPENKFTKNALCQPPEFLKVFTDVHCAEGEKAIFDCVLLGSPRPKVCWLFNNEKMTFIDVILEDTSDVCRCTIKYVRPYHYGTYTVCFVNNNTVVAYNNVSLEGFG